MSDSAVSARGSSRGRGRGGSQRRDFAQTPRPTHFISLPLHTHEALKDKLDAFYDSVLSVAPETAGLERVVFQKTNRIHMTLGVMCLDSTSRGGNGPQAPGKTVSDALELLESLQSELVKLIGDAGSIRLPLSGLKVMIGRNDEAYCVYTGPGDKSDDGAMWKACLFIHERFKSAGFLTDIRPLKLHCTLINSTFRKPRSAFSFTAVLDAITQNPGPSGISLPRPTPAQVSKLADFGSWSVGEVHICRLGSWDAEGRYVSHGHISLAQDK